MNLMNFFRRFPNEESCRLDFKNKRDQAGIICKKCACKEHYWKEDKQVYQCKNCSFRTSLRSGTVMESSKLPFQYWYISMHLLTATKKGISALELQRQLGHKRYEPIWYMLHKLRLIMGKSDDKYQLNDSVELDEAFLSNGSEGNVKKVPILVAAESIPVSGFKKKQKIKYQSRYIKMTVLESRTKEGLLYEAKKMINKESEVITDGAPSFKTLSSIFRKHQAFIVKDKSKISKIQPWAHIVISNVKRWLLGIHHSAHPKYLQNYLNEFCYKYNRRYFGENLFDNLLFHASSKSWF